MVGRFTSIDRFADKFPYQSPYTYAGNNPLRFTDINGDSIPNAWELLKEMVRDVPVIAKDAVTEAWGYVNDWIGGSNGQRNSGGSGSTSDQSGNTQKGGMVLSSEAGRNEEAVTAEKAEAGPNIDLIIATAGVTKSATFGGPNSASSVANDILDLVDFASDMGSNAADVIDAIAPQELPLKRADSMTFHRVWPGGKRSETHFEVRKAKTNK